MKTKKVVRDLKEAIRLCNLKDGMTISFHHHLRNGDYVVNMGLEAISELGIKDIQIAPSAIFPIHEPLIKYIKNGVVTSIATNYIRGPVAEAISTGAVKLKRPIRFMSHGGRARAIEDGDLPIDIAFIAAPSADPCGNINGFGPSGCGSLGYAFSDADNASKVIAVTDNLVDYPLKPVSIDETKVDYVVKVNKIGNPEGIVAGTTKITRDPIGLLIAQKAGALIKASGMLKEGFSFQTGAGGTSLAVAKFVSDEMKKNSIHGSFASGGITGFFVKMLEEGLFSTILDVQDFDLEGVKSLRENNNHIEISASRYANPHAKSCAVNNLDVVVLGATEIDTSFNVNVLTDSNGMIMGGSGGHCDTAAGAKLTIIVTNLLKARLPIVVDKVLTIITPGDSVDAVVTERGVAINPKNQALIDKLKESKFPLTTIEELKSMVEKIAGKPKKIKLSNKVIGEVEYRDGTIIDQVKLPI